jgi:hypothetical protein
MISIIKQKIYQGLLWCKAKAKWILLTIATILGFVGYAAITDPIVIQSEIIQAIEIKQEKYFEQHGRYWQGLSTKDLTKKPHYQNKGWNEFIDSKFLKDIPFEIIVNTYKDPQGEQGYQIFFRWEEGNTKFMKSKGYGVQGEQKTFEQSYKNTTST